VGGGGRRGEIKAQKPVGKITVSVSSITKSPFLFNIHIIGYLKKVSMDTKE
jgi:hypothetical protein